MSEDAVETEDKKYESSPEAFERGRLARDQFARGEYKSLEQVKKEFGIEPKTGS